MVAWLPGSELPVRGIHAGLVRVYTVALGILQFILVLLRLSLCLHITWAPPIFGGDSDREVWVGACDPAFLTATCDGYTPGLWTVSWEASIQVTCETAFNSQILDKAGGLSSQ